MNKRNIADWESEATKCASATCALVSAHQPIRREGSVSYFSIRRLRTVHSYQIGGISNLVFGIWLFGYLWNSRP
jgi:hypothetical protein